MRGKIFISHSTAHRDATERARRVLESVDYGSVFVSFDPEDGIRPGALWEREVYQALNACDAVVAINSAGWRGSRWCFAEMTMARSLGKPVIVLRSDPGAVDEKGGTAGLLSDLQWLDFGANAAEVSAILVGELLRCGVRARRAFAWDPTRSPYPGLAPLDVADAGVFFGRDQDTREVVDLLERAVAYGDKRMVAIVGTSGSGKSSLLRAGVLARLRDHEAWDVHGPLMPRQDLQKRLVQVHHALAGPLQDRHLLVAVDQIDEFLAADETARELLELLAGLFAARTGGVVVLGTVRWNAFPKFEAVLGPLRERVTQKVLRQMTRPGQRDLIREPARLAGVDIEDDLVEQLLDEMTERETLPLLAVTLRTLWDHRGIAGMTLDAYRSQGGLEGAVARAVESVLRVNQLAPADEDELRAALLSMVQVDRRGDLSPRPVRLDSLSHRTQHVLRGFVGEGLLLTGKDGTGSIELAHRALIDTWPRLREWVDGERDLLMRVDRLEAAVEQWRADPRVRLSGVNLGEAEELRHAGHPVTQNDAVRTLIEASVQDRAMAEHREMERVRAIDIGESLRLASQARELTEREPETALLLAGEAMHRDRNELTETVFREALARLPAPTKILAQLPQIQVAIVENAVAAATREFGSVYFWDGAGRNMASQWPDGKLLRITGLPGTDRILVWHGTWLSLFTATGEKTGVLALDDAGGAQDMTLRATRDGHVVLHAAERVWLVRVTGDALVPDGELHVPTGGRTSRRVFQAVPNADASLLLTQGDDMSSQVWTRDGRRIFRSALPGTPLPITGEFLAGGRVVVSTSRGGLYLWPSLDGAPRVLREPREDARDSVIRAVSRDGGLVAASETDDDVLRVWTADGDEIATLVAHPGGVRAADFSSDGRHLATGGEDRTVALWEWPSGRQVVRLAGHQHAVRSVEFLGDDSQTVLSSDVGGYLRWWRPFATALPDLTGPDASLSSLTCTADGISGSGQGGTWIWRRGERSVAPAGEQVAPPSRPAGFRLPARAFHGRRPDGGAVVVAQPDGTVTVTAPDGRTLGERHRSDVWSDEVRSFAVDPLGEYIALGRRKDVLFLDWTGREVCTVPVAGYKVQTTTFTPDGLHLVTVADSPGSSPVVQITGRSGRPAAVPDVAVTSHLQVDPQSRFLCFWGASTALFLDLAGVEIGLLAADAGVEISRLTIAPDGSLVAAAFSDDVVRIWSTEQGRQVQSMPITPNCTCLAFDHDARRLLAGTPGGPVRQYAIDVTELLPAASERVSRPTLTEADARRFALAEITFDLDAYRRGR